MKRLFAFYIIVLLIGFMIGIELANATEKPKYLEGAEITVTLKNGKKYKFKSEEYAVVKRDQMLSSLKIKAELAEVKEKIKTKKLVKNRKNRIYVLGGYGNTHKLETSTNGSTYETKNKKGFVGGVGYQRKVTEKVNVGIQAQTNGTGNLSVGLDF